MIRRQNAVTSQTNSRERVRHLAEVYTHGREVKAMLDLIPDMFPSKSNPRNIRRSFLEPACGSGNFLVDILARKLSYVCRPHYRSAAAIEAAALQALTSIYGIDIDDSNVDASRHFVRVEMEHHMNLVMNTESVTPGFFMAVDAILTTNIIRADTLKDARYIDLVGYCWQRKTGYVLREWSKLEPSDDPPDLFSSLIEPAPKRDAVPFHYSQLANNPRPVVPPKRGAA